MFAARSLRSFALVSVVCAAAIGTAGCRHVGKQQATVGASPQMPSEAEWIPNDTPSPWTGHTAPVPEPLPMSADPVLVPEDVLPALPGVAPSPVPPAEEMVPMPSRVVAPEPMETAPPPPAEEPTAPTPAPTTEHEHEHEQTPATIPAPPEPGIEEAAPPVPHEPAPSPEAEARAQHPVGPLLERRDWTPGWTRPQHFSNAKSVPSATPRTKAPRPASAPPRLAARPMDSVPGKLPANAEMTPVEEVLLEEADDVDMPRLESEDDSLPPSPSAHYVPLTAPRVVPTGAQQPGRLPTTASTPAQLPRIIPGTPSRAIAPGVEAWPYAPVTSVPQP